ncbi:MAG: nucleotidyltransferase domain-containing protein [Ignavibacteria bacterium]|nr:nucleotidyltransferase domain-containing protein [Ignavibacteria bacterium]
MISPELQKITQQVVQKLRASYTPLKVILYGYPGVDSDIDLLIIKDTPERFIDRWVSIRQILSDPTRKVAIEPLELTPQEVAERLARGDQFISEILEKGHVLYAV